MRTIKFSRLSIHVFQACTSPFHKCCIHSCRLVFHIQYVTYHIVIDSFYNDSFCQLQVFDESLVYIYDSDGRQQEQELELTAGRSIAVGLMEQGMPATAVLCVNDMLAIGLIQTMRKNGVQVPEDISVVGFDDIPLAEALVPALTTVRYPAEEIGRLTAMVLLDPMINTMTRTPLTMNLTPELVCRDTVRRIG